MWSSACARDDAPWPGFPEPYLVRADEPIFLRVDQMEQVDVPRSNRVFVPAPSFSYKCVVWVKCGYAKRRATQSTDYELYDEAGCMISGALCTRVIDQTDSDSDAVVRHACCRHAWLATQEPRPVGKVS